MKAKLVFLSLLACWVAAHIPSLALSSKPQEKGIHKLLIGQSGAELEPARPADATGSTETTRPTDAARPAETVRKVGNPYSKERYRDSKSIVKVQSHDFEGQTAATLYVREVPVFTFLAEESAQEEELESAQVPPKLQAKLPAPKAQANPLSRATAVAAKLNQFYEQDSRVVEEIVPAWNEAEEQYGIQMGEEPLLTLDGSTFLSDSSQNPEEDIRHSVNRLRRLMGENSLGVDAAEAKWVEEVSAAEISKLRSPAANSKESLPSQVGRFFGEGLASWYGPGFHGRLTANGEIYDQNAMTAAHKHLPFGTLVRVVNLDNGRSTVVRINDRGPYIPGREIDLSAAAAQTLGAVQSGIAPVRMEILD